MEYVVPFVSPVIVIGLAVPVVVIAEPLGGVAVTVYEVIALPPFDEGAVKDTVARALPALAVTFCGAPGGAATTVTVTVYVCVVPSAAVTV